MTLRAFALAATLAIHGVFAWLVFAPRSQAPHPQAHLDHEEIDETPRLHEAARPQPARPAASGSRRPHRPFEPGSPASRFRSPEELAAYERGATYELARRDSVLRLYDRAYGPQIGALMRLPLPEAWRALETLADEGDLVAGDALTMLAGCATDIPERGEHYQRLRTSAIEGLAPVDAAFVHGALDTELLGMENDARTCAAAGLDHGRLVALAQRRLAANGTPEAPPTGDDRHAWIRYFERAFPPVEGPTWTTDVGADARPWLDRLDAALSIDDWIRLRDSPPDDPVLMMRVAYCAMSRCPDLPPEAWTAADRFIERSAEYGHSQSISRVIEQRAEARALAEAHAWAEFGMWTIASGCFPIAQSIEYAQLARQRQAIAARLTAAQFAEARVRLAGLMRAHGDAALAAQGCLP